MKVVELLIPLNHPNRPGFAITPRGVVVHRTGRDVGALWLGNYFGRDPRAVLPEPPWGNGYVGNGQFGRYGSAHYGIDDDVVARFIPEDEGAYHAASARPAIAYSRNGTDLGVELCQYFDEPPRIRPRTYANAVAFAAAKCRQYGWSGPREVDELGPRFTRHQDHDPIDRPHDTGDYLRWDDYLDDVERAIAGTPWVPKEDDMDGDTVKNLFREMLNSEEGANLVRTAILRKPNGYGPALAEQLERDYYTRAEVDQRDREVEVKSVVESQLGVKDECLKPKP